MKNYKKLFCIFLSTIMVLGMVAGCAGDKPAETTEVVTEAIVTEVSEVVEITVETEPVTTEAEPVEYEITYEVNGGVLPEDAEEVYTEEVVLVLPVPTKEGCIFDGWYENEDFSGEPVTTTEGATGDKTYYAKWNTFINEEPEATEPSVSEETEPAHVHDYTKTVTDPTCTSKGYTTYKCACGDTYTDNEVAATGHDYESQVVAPTTSAQGYTLHTCKVCGDSYKDSYTDKLPVETQPEETEPPATEETEPAGCQHSWQEIHYDEVGHKEYVCVDTHVSPARTGLPMCKAFLVKMRCCITPAGARRAPTS